LTFQESFFNNWVHLPFEVQITGGVKLNRGYACVEAGIGAGFGRLLNQQFWLSVLVLNTSLRILILLFNIRFYEVDNEVGISRMIGARRDFAGYE
jgi:hypothetical protein